jgi:osmoprotectant transport system substrate-binding protein
MRLTRRDSARILAAPAAAAVLAACGQLGGAARGGGKPTVRIGSANFAEAVILGELYAQALEAGQYKVERKLNLGSREIYAPALDSGKIDLVPEYLATYTTYVTKDQAKSTTDPATTLKNLQDFLSTKKSLTALDFAQAVDTNGTVVTKATADKYKLQKTSDLLPLAGQLLLGGPPECPQRAFCLQGLESTYGLKFKGFQSLDAGGPLTVEALEGNQIDVAILFTTDPNITAKGFVLLQDDKHLQLADNVIPLVRSDVLNESPADLKTLINGVTAKLTTDELTALNKQVQIDKQAEKTVAGAWLKAKGLVS